MIRSPRPVVAAVALTLLVAGTAACGGDEGSASADTSPEQTTTTLDAAAQVAELDVALDRLEDFGRSNEEAVADVAGTGNEDLIATFEALKGVVEGFNVVLSVSGDPQLQGGTAIAQVQITSNGEPFPDLYPAFFEQVDGEWKITRAGVCSLVTAGGITCPEAPGDASTAG